MERVSQVYTRYIGLCRKKAGWHLQFIILSADLINFASIYNPYLFFRKMDPVFLLEMVKMRMPFGKYKGWLICDLPESYLVWFNSKGFPTGKLGLQLQTMYEIRLNGLEYLLKPIKEGNFNPSKPTKQG